MKISYNWLKEFVDVDLAPRDLAEKLTMVGLAVDGVEEHGEDFVLDIDLTSNRPDCLSHLGVAREVAAITRQSLRMPAAETGRRGDKERTMSRPFKFSVLSFARGIQRGLSKASRSGLRRIGWSNGWK